MLPAAANKLGKKYGAQVGRAEMSEGFPGTGTHPTGNAVEDALGAIQDKMHIVHTTPDHARAARGEALRKGFPLFVAGGATTGALAAQDRLQSRAAAIGADDGTERTDGHTSLADPAEPTSPAPGPPRRIRRISLRPIMPIRSI